MPSKKLHRPKAPEASKEEFLDAAMHLFNQKGFFLTSVDDIVRKAGRSKGGFYHHFKSKNVLLRGLFYKMMQEFGTILLDEIKKGRTIEKAFDSYMGHPQVKNILRSNCLKAVAELYTIALRDRKIRELMLEFHRQAIDMFAQVFTIARNRGELSFTEEPAELADDIYHEIRGSMILDIILYDGRGLERRFRSFIGRNLRALGYSR